MLFAIHMVGLSVYYFIRWFKANAAQKQEEATAKADSEGVDAAPDVAVVTNPASVDENDAEDGDTAAAKGAGTSLVIKDDALIPFTFVSMAITGAVIGVVGGMFGIGAHETLQCRFVQLADYFCACCGLLNARCWCVHGSHYDRTHGHDEKRCSDTVHAHSSAASICWSSHRIRCA